MIDDKEKQRGYRVQNMMKRINLADVESLKRWAIVKLLKTQPLARRIRFEEHCSISHCGSSLSMSYVLEEFRKPGRINHRGELSEDCGYFCPHCGFSNAGSRPILKWRNAIVIRDDEMQAAQAYLDALKLRKVSDDRKFLDFHHDDKRK